MKDPILSVIEGCEHPSSPEGVSNRSFSACEDNSYPENDGVLSASAGIVICSAPETPNSDYHIASQAEEFRTPPEECRRSSSCEEPPRLPPSNGYPKSDSPDSSGASGGDDVAVFDSARARLKNNMDNLGFSKARISEMMHMLSDGKVRVRSVLNVELEQFNVRKGGTNSKEDSIQPPPKKLKALAERIVARGSPKEIMKGKTVIPSSHAVAEKVQSTEPLEIDQVEDDIDEVAGFCDTDGGNSSQEELALATEAAEKGIARRSCDRVSDKDPGKIGYDFVAEKEDEDERNKIKNGKISSSKGKGGGDDEGYINGSPAKRNLPSSVVRPAEGGNVVEKDTMIRNLTDKLGVESEQTTKDGDDGDINKEKNSYSNGGKRALGDDSAAKQDGEDTIKSILEVLGVLRREIQRSNHYGEVDILETAKRHGITFPRPRWWPNPAGDD